MKQLFKGFLALALMLCTSMMVSAQSGKSLDFEKETGTFHITQLQSDYQISLLDFGLNLDQALRFSSASSDNLITFRVDQETSALTVQLHTEHRDHWDIDAWNDYLVNKAERFKKHHSTLTSSH